MLQPMSAILHILYVPMTCIQRTYIKASMGDTMHRTKVNWNKARRKVAPPPLPHPAKEATSLSSSRLMKSEEADTGTHDAWTEDMMDSSWRPGGGTAGTSAVITGAGGEDTRRKQDNYNDDDDDNKADTNDDERHLFVPPPVPLLNLTTCLLEVLCLMTSSACEALLSVYVPTTTCIKIMSWRFKTCTTTSILSENTQHFTITHTHTHRATQG